MTDCPCIAKTDTLSIHREIDQRQWHDFHDGLNHEHEWEYIQTTVLDATAERLPNRIACTMIGAVIAWFDLGPL